MLARRILFVMRRCKNWREIVPKYLRGEPATTIILRNGVRIDSPTDSLSIVHEVFFRQVYNPSYLQIGYNDVVVDIGAHIGIFALFAAFRTKNSVYAFEPLCENVKFINRNIELNKLHNIMPVRAAVCDRVGLTKLFLTEVDYGHLLFDHNITGKLENYVEVPATTLQNVMNENDLRKIGFLKLDCEGSEGLILTSTRSDYLRRIRKVAIEFHDHVSPLKHDDIRALLEKEGFVTRLNWDGRSPFGYIYGWNTG